MIDATRDVYRLTLDENGQDDCRDFTNQADALLAFGKAKRRASVFSARLALVTSDDVSYYGQTIAEFERA